MDYVVESVLIELREHPAGHVSVEREKWSSGAVTYYVAGQMQGDTTDRWCLTTDDIDEAVAYFIEVDEALRRWPQQP